MAISHQSTANPTTYTLKEKIARDAVFREFVWTVALGKTTASSPMYKTDAAALRRFVQQTSLPKGKGSPKIPPPARTLVPPAESIPRMRLSPKLEIYYFHMRRAVRLTCHPRQIHAEALLLVTALLEGPRALAVEHAAKAIFLAGTGRIEQTRSAALLAHDALTELMTRDWTAKTQLEAELVAMTTLAFVNCWDTKELSQIATETGLDPISKALESNRTQMVNVAAFIGSLFAMNIMSADSMRSLVSTLVKSLSSATECRGLYILLLHANPHININPLGAAFYADSRKVLVQKAKHYKDYMISLWLTEICTVIDESAAQEPGKPNLCQPTIICHEWSMRLTKDPLLGLLPSTY